MFIQNCDRFGQSVAFLVHNYTIELNKYICAVLFVVTAFSELVLIPALHHSRRSFNCLVSTILNKYYRLSINLSGNVYFELSIQQFRHVNCFNLKNKHFACLQHKNTFRHRKAKHTPKKRINKQ